MLPYLLVLTCAVLLAVLSDAYQRQKMLMGQVAPPVTQGSGIPHKVSFFDVALVSVLVVFMGFRTVGTDTPFYVSIFDLLDSRDWSYSLENVPQEPGYIVLQLVTKTVSESSTALLVICACLIVIPIVFVLRKKSEIYPLAVFLYIAFAYYLSTFNVMRQGIAVSLLFLGDYFWRRSKLTFVLLAILAVLIHVSALFGILVYLLARLVRPSYLLLGVSLVVGAMAALTASFGEQAIAIVSYFNERYSSYLIEYQTGLGLYFVVAVQTAFCVYVLTMRKKVEINDLYATLLILSVFFLLLGTQFKFLARVEMYTSIFMIILIPQVVSQVRNKGAHYLVLGVGGVAYMVVYILNYGGIFPYEWSL